MEEKERVVYKTIDEAKKALFEAVNTASTEARRIIEHYPPLVNASTQIKLSSGEYETVPLINSILYAAKRGIGKDDTSAEKELISLAKFILGYDQFDILQKNLLSKDTSLHRAVWYEYLEIAEIIIGKAEEKKKVRDICAIRNSFSETPLSTLARALKNQEGTQENQQKFEGIRALLIAAQQREHNRKLNEQCFAKTAEAAMKEFYEKLAEDILEDHITFELLKKPVIVFPGHTISESYFEDPLVNPDINPYTREASKEKVPHHLAQSLINLYTQFPPDKENSVEEFFISVESLLYCPLTNKPLEIPRVVAEHKVVNTEDLYGMTCDKAAIENIDKTLSTYQDILLEEVLGFKKKYDEKLSKLAKQVDQGGLLQDDQETPITLPSSSTREKSVTVIVSEKDQRDFSIKIFQLFSSTPEYIKKIEAYLEKNFNPRFDKITWDIEKDYTAIKLEAFDSVTISKLSKFFVEEEKITTWQEIDPLHGSQIDNSAQMSVQISNSASNDIQNPYTSPATKSSVFTFSSIQQASYIISPTQIEYYPTTDKNSGKISIHFNPKDVSSVCGQIAKLQRPVCNISRRENVFSLEIKNRDISQLSEVGTFVGKEQINGQMVEIIGMKFINTTELNKFSKLFGIKIDNDLVKLSTSNENIILINSGVFAKYSLARGENSDQSNNNKSIVPDSSPVCSVM